MLDEGDAGLGHAEPQQKKAMTGAKTAI